MCPYLSHPDLLVVQDAVDLDAEEAVCAVLSTVAWRIAPAIPCQVHLRASNPSH